VELIERIYYDWTYVVGRKERALELLKTLPVRAVYSVKFRNGEEKTGFLIVTENREIFWTGIVKNTRELMECYDFMIDKDLPYLGSLSLRMENEGKVEFEIYELLKEKGFKITAVERGNGRSSNEKE